MVNAPDANINKSSDIFEILKNNSNDFTQSAKKN